MVKFSVSVRALKHHFNYMGWAYIVLPLAAVLLWALVYNMTVYSPPREKTLTFFMVGAMYESERTEALAEEIFPDFPEIELVDVRWFPLTHMDNVDEMIRFQTMLYAGEGDVCILDRDLFLVLAREEMFLPLEGLLETDIDLEPYTFALEPGAERHTYAVSADSLFGFMQQEGFDNRNTVLAMLAYTPNQHESARLVQWLLDNRSAPPPEGSEAWSARVPYFNEDLGENYLEYFGYE